MHQPSHRTVGHRGCRLAALLPALAASLTITAPHSLATASPGEVTQGSGYADLVALFGQWREFQAPRLDADGVPDYSASAMAAQHAALDSLRSRLAAMDIDAWPVPQQIDHHLVRAEMNGLDFDHRVRRPWENNPAFYVMIFTAQSDVPAHEGPVIHTWIDTWTYDYPLSQDDAAALAARIRVIPPLLEQARDNLVGNARELWVRGIGSLRRQGRELAGLLDEVSGTRLELDRAIGEAIRASDSFADWLQERASSKTGPSGVGADNYTWYLQNVHLVPFTWEEEVTLLRRELVRAHAALRLEENRNRDLPTLDRFATPEEYDEALNEAVDEYVVFLRREEIVSMRPWMDAALRARIGRFSPLPPEGLRGFFSEIQYRDGVVMRTHGMHWIDLARMEHEPHESPIRRVPALSNIYDGRSEGWATGMEEMMMHAGLLDDRPRARELIWILLIQRAARGLGGLYQHANEWTLQEAAEFASQWVPRGYLPADGATILGEEHFYLTQPGYGTSYVIGKIEIERLLAERALQLGEAFTLKRFIDEFDATGIIPVTLARWEMTGHKDPILESSGR